MPDALRVGLLGPLLVRDEAGRAVHVGGRQLRLLLILLALDAGRVVPSAALATTPTIALTTMRRSGVTWTFAFLWCQWRRWCRPGRVR